MRQLMESSTKHFYLNLKSFLKELNGTFPEDDELKMITSSITIYSMDDDENTLIKKFYTRLHPLESLIQNHDNMFFAIDHSVYWKKSSYEYALFTKLTGYWSQLNETNRKVVWDYIHLIYNLSKDFNERN
jgi:hypothetical protein